MMRMCVVLGNVNGYDACASFLQAVGAVVYQKEAAANFTIHTLCFAIHFNIRLAIVWGEKQGPILQADLLR